MREVLEQLRSIAGECAGAPVWALSGTDLIASLHAVHDVEQMLAAVKLHGRPEFIPPYYVDPEHRPRRNIYHRRT